MTDYVCFSNPEDHWPQWESIPEADWTDEEVAMVAAVERELGRRMTEIVYSE